MPLATAVRTRCPAPLLTALRDVTGQHQDWTRTAELAAAQLRAHLPGPDLLTPEERAGDPAGYVSHVLHTEPDGSFSVCALVWRPGQLTRIHDHVTWCVFGVIQGVGEGEVSGFAPPGDIHRVRNHGDGVAISLHVYGADITRLGSSVRRVYDLPVRRRGRA